MNQLTSLFAYGVVNLSMLGWLAAAAAPILIHLWSRRKYREMSWAAMEYLLAAMRRKTRRLYFEQWLLLALRTLIIVLLVMAVAEPFLQPNRLVHDSTARTHRVIVVDGSYSMAYKPGEQNRFQTAKQLASQIVEQSRQGDIFSLVLMASPPQIEVGTAALDRKGIHDAIRDLARPDTSADLPATVRELQKLIDRVGKETPDQLQHEIYFLTDLQRVGWKPRLTTASAKQFRQSSRRLAESAALMIIDLGQPTAENVAVTRLRALQSTTTLSQTINFEASLKNFGSTARTRQNVELLVDGKHVADKQLDLPPGGSAVVDFSYRFETADDHVVEILAEGDLLEVDNRRWMSVPVREAIRVLCVDGRPSGESFGSATDYLVSALWPWNEDSESAWIRPEVVAESALLERDLSQYDCIFLCSVAQFTAGEARVLDGYLSRGGSVVFFLGEGVLADRYNRELGGSDLESSDPGGGDPDGGRLDANADGGRRILPAQLGEIVEGEQYRLDPLEYRHPIAREFRGHERAGLLTTPVSKYFKLNLPKNSRAKVALATGRGDPLIVEERIGRGRVVLVATSADDSWTVMPRWPSYPAIVHELLAFCLGEQLDNRNAQVGATLAGSIPTPAEGNSGRMRNPDGDKDELRLQPDGDYSFWQYSNTKTAGIYKATFPPPTSNEKEHSRTFAVNVNTIESDLTQLSVEQLKTEVWPEVPFVHRTTWQDGSQAAAEPIVRPARIHVWLLCGVLGLLFTETFVAWRFGHHTT